MLLIYINQSQKVASDVLDRCFAIGISDIKVWLNDLVYLLKFRFIICNNI